MNYQAVIFDLDGTLINSLEDIADSVNYALIQNGFPIHTCLEVNTFVGRGIRNLIKSSLPEQSRTDEVIDKCLADFINHYREHCLDKTVLYDGISDMLDRLTSKGLKLAILSNKSQELTALIASKLFSKWNFEIVLGASETTKRKPNPAGALSIAENLRISPQSIVFVGDSKFDIETAISANMLAVGVSWGFRKKEELILAQANFIINHPEDLVSIV